MTALAARELVDGLTEADVRRALDTVFDPELDEPITDLGFVRSIEVGGSVGADVMVHLRLPTSFCSPNFAWIMAGDARDVLQALPGVGEVVVELDDHHDSDLINDGLRRGADYKGTFKHEAEQDLDELRMVFRRKAHTAAMERCLTDLLREQPGREEASLGRVRLSDLPEGDHQVALLRRREALGLPLEPDALVLVDEQGRGCRPDEVPMRLRRARSVRISVDGNAHFCRGLLRTRYAGSGEDQSTRTDGAEPGDHHHLLPLTVKEFPS